MRDVLLFVHIVGVAGWIGAGLYSVYAYSTLAQLEPQAASAAFAALQKREDRFFGPTTALVLLSGIGLVLVSDAYRWGSVFVLIGIGVFVVSAILNSTVSRKATTRLTESVAAGSGAIPALRSWRRVTAWEFAALFVALWSMIVKLGA